MTGSAVALMEETNEAASSRNSQQPPSDSSSRCRSRSRSRRRSQRRHRSRFFGSSKNKESNFLAAIANMAVVVLICTAIADPQWFYIYGGGCRDQNDHAINYLGMNQFIVSGQFAVIDKASIPKGTEMLTKYTYGSAHSDVLIDCVNQSIVDIMHVILAVCFLSVLLSLLAFLLDLSGSTYKVLKIVREFAVLSILTVIFCVMVNGFCFWTTEHLDDLQKMGKINKGSKVIVEFSVSFYLIAAAGAMSVIATACNLLRKPSSQSDNSYRYDRLAATHANHDDDLMGLLEEEPPYVAPPPPPPYSP